MGQIGLNSLDKERVLSVANAAVPVRDELIQFEQPTVTIHLFITETPISMRINVSTNDVLIYESPCQSHIPDVRLDSGRQKSSLSCVGDE